MLRTSFVACLVACAPLVACGGTKETPSPSAADVAPARRDGRVRLEDRWVEVTPLVIHEAKMDLAVSCRIVRERAKQAGQPEPPLCYGNEPRQAAAIKVIRVEHQPGASTDAMRRLAGSAESAHFVIERSGSRFQLLDLMYPARRDEAVRPDEVRVIVMDGLAPRSGAEAAAPLVADLQALFPAARVDTVDVAPREPTPPSPPTTTAPAAGDTTP